MSFRTVVVAGNPKPQSRTLDAGVRLAHRLGAAPESVSTIDVIELGAGLFAWGDERVAGAVELAQSADLLVVATPTYKASYTGVLKLFLDQFAGGTGLAGVTAVPLMLGGSHTHALAGEVHLKPVLAEIGAAVPTPAIFQIDKAYEDDPALDAWLEQWGPVVRTLAEAGSRRHAAGDAPGN